jgi:hypothetical protein
MYNKKKPHQIRADRTAVGHSSYKPRLVWNILKAGTKTADYLPYDFYF